MPPCDNGSGEFETFMLGIILVDEDRSATSSKIPVSTSTFSAAKVLVAGMRAGETS